MCMNTVSTTANAGTERNSPPMTRMTATDATPLQATTDDIKVLIDKEMGEYFLRSQCIPYRPARRHDADLHVRGRVMFCEGAGERNIPRELYVSMDSAQKAISRVKKKFPGWSKEEQYSLIFQSP